MASASGYDKENGHMQCRYKHLGTQKKCIAQRNKSTVTEMYTSLHSVKSLAQENTESKSRLPLDLKCCHFVHIYIVVRKFVIAK